jgi:uncharacterized protein (DUF2249 family)
MTEIEQRIDVRKILPQKKHSAIFNTYDELNKGEAFVIINDNDPKPLHYQMAGMHGDERFSWEYLQEGPEVWKVRIGKTG